ncbi:hypothetical protein Tco_1486778 [Tanacetum coccineum]
MVVKETKIICPILVKNVEIDGMTHDRKDDFEVELDLRDLELHPICHQEKDEVVLKLDDVSLVDRVFDGAFSGDGDEDFVIGEGVFVSSALSHGEEGIEEEDNNDEEENKSDDYLIKMKWINVVSHGYIDFGFQKVSRKM